MRGDSRTYITCCDFNYFPILAVVSRRAAFVTTYIPFVFLRTIKKQGLGQLLIGAPRLMLLADKHGVVGAALAKGAGDEVVVQALR